MTDITVTYTVLSVDVAGGVPTATVLFNNPLKTGPEDTENLDVTKTVLVPFTPEGAMDADEWTKRLEQQANGVKNRILSSRKPTVSLDMEALGVLIGVAPPAEEPPAE